MSVRVQSLELRQVGLFRALTIAFNPSINVICGANGVGKTTILEAIAALFADAGTFDAANKFKYTNASIIANICINNINNYYFGLRFLVSAKIVDNNNVQSHKLGAEDILYFTADRDIRYEQLEYLPRLGRRNAADIAQRVINDLPSVDLKGWLTNRLLLQNAEYAERSYSKKANVHLALKSMSSIDENVAFHHVDPLDFEIWLTTPGGIVLLEALSSGYRTILLIILGLVKEMNYDLKTLQPTNFPASS